MKRGGEGSGKEEKEEVCTLLIDLSDCMVTRISDIQTAIIGVPCDAGGSTELGFISFHVHIS